MATKEPKGKPVSDDEAMPMHKKLAMGKMADTGGAKGNAKGGAKTRP